MNKDIKNICCEVENCKHHKPDNSCNAIYIKVGCDCTKAHNISDTICETFEECDNESCGINPCDNDCNCDNSD